MHHSAYRQVVEKQFGVWNQAEEDSFFDELWRNASVEAIVCDGEPVGFCVLVRGDGDIHVRELVVDPRHQGRGIGAKVLQHVLKEAEREGIRVRLETHRVNRAESLYRRLGFVETGLTETQRLFEWTPPGVS